MLPETASKIMITPKKLHKALEAIQGVMVEARRMAYANEDQQHIAKLLDHGEYLPGLLLEDRDATKEFEDYLKAIVADFPMCQRITDKFLIPD
ncbi:MAG: hypothetical protein WC076_12720 [Terrimicrobiaceae bacterium]|jgi:hypothetical protein